MDRILIIRKKENGPRASSAPALGLNTIIFKHVYWYMQQTQVSVYRTIGPLVLRSRRSGFSTSLAFTNIAAFFQQYAIDWIRQQNLMKFIFNNFKKYVDYLKKK